MALLVTLMVALGGAAGYLGWADQIADGFKVLTFLFGGMILIGLAAGGIRVSGRRSLPHIAPRVRRTAA
ncbi:hypothetical protein [Hyphomonas sp.]|uniref:hypothetical protein n=1 Tax=Hyphomonas sp. TaxID=87 RepID=UPI0025C46BB3|nr:hypothetical protein [Hyphomonas sp.]